MALSVAARKHAFVGGSSSLETSSVSKKLLCNFFRKNVTSCKTECLWRETISMICETFLSFSRLLRPVSEGDK